MSSEEEQAESTPAGGIKTEMIDQIFSAATEKKASHIHLEPSGDEIYVRFRIRGKLVSEPSIPTGATRTLIARLKGLARMDIKDTLHCQDGPYRYTTHDGTLVTGRISTLPSLNGETCVITCRIGEQILSLKQIGMEPEQIDTLHQLLSIPAGMTLITGPWSSGKTLTLYVIAKHLNEDGLSVVSLEDPIELELPGITQTQVSRRIGLTFARGMRAILRQDPDTIALGEIHNLEEASLATDACIQGRYRVVAGLSTSTVINAIRWLIDSGLSTNIIASAVSGVVVQRLVNRVCDNCKQSVTLSQETIDSIGYPLPASGPWVTGAGCDKCNDTGYRGKVGIFEVVPINDEVKEVIRKEPTPLLLKKALRSQEIPSLREMGIKKAELGITTLEEVLRVTS